MRLEVAVEGGPMGPSLHVRVPVPRFKNVKVLASIYAPGIEESVRPIVRLQVIVATGIVHKSDLHPITVLVHGCNRHGPTFHLGVPHHGTSRLQVFVLLLHDLPGWDPPEVQRKGKRPNVPRGEQDQLIPFRLPLRALHRHHLKVEKDRRSIPQQPPIDVHRHIRPLDALEVFVQEGYPKKVLGFGTKVKFEPGLAGVQIG
mmetsp:Transcript_3510/g.5390  ORF Transcript_3510/g.5390 Transcript_3510/m.5390 type:complete len:201 (+) Transcript_3510:842-1444(+)